MCHTGKNLNFLKIRNNNYRLLHNSILQYCYAWTKLFFCWLSNSIATTPHNSRHGKGWTYRQDRFRDLLSKSPSYCQFYQTSRQFLESQHWETFTFLQVQQTKINVNSFDTHRAVGPYCNLYLPTSPFLIKLRCTLGWQFLIQNVRYKLY